MDPTTDQTDHTRYAERLTLLVPSGTKRKLDEVARGLGMTMSELVRQHLATAIEQKTAISQMARELVLNTLLIRRLRSRRTQRKLAEDLTRARFDHAAALRAVESEHARREVSFGGAD